MIAGTAHQDRLASEQDASYHSGDVYNDIALSRQRRIYVGQFAPLYAFINGRGGGNYGAGGLSKKTYGDILKVLTVGLPGTVTKDAVPGSVEVSGSVNPVRVWFRENYHIPMADEIENAVGVYFTALQPGVYTLHAPDPLTDPIVFRYAFNVDFTELSRLEVVDIGVQPDPAQPIYETEEVTFAVTGDSTAQYALDWGSATPHLGSINGLRYSAPLLPASAASDHQALRITATYRRDNAVFRNPADTPAVNLRDDQLMNICRQFDLTIQALTAPALGPVAAHSITDFEMPIAPATTRVDPFPAGVTGIAQVINLGGRPCRLKFLAPAAVAAPVDVTFRLIYGRTTGGAAPKEIPVTVRVNP